MGCNNYTQCKCGWKEIRVMHQLKGFLEREIMIIFIKMTLLIILEKTCSCMYYIQFHMKRKIFWHQVWFLVFFFSFFWGVGVGVKRRHNGDHVFGGTISEYTLILWTSLLFNFFLNSRFQLSNVQQSLFLCKKNFRIGYYF